MTEPPQPPNPSGYGHLPGPPQPGYGFPPQQGENPYAQQPQQPPQPQPQGPYGQQLQGGPYGQQLAGGYGFPPQPPHMPPGAPGFPGMPPAPPAGPKKKLGVLIAAAVAGVLVLGTGGYFLLSGDDKRNDKVIGEDTTPPPVDDKASPSASVDKGDGSGNGGEEEQDLNAGRKQGEDKVLWLKTSTINGPGGGVDSKGQWIVGDTVVKTVWKSVTGYGVKDGKEKWTLALPAEICGVTDMTADGKTVVMYKNGESDGADCNMMRLIDLKAGKEGWTKEVPKEGLFDIMTSPDLALTGDALVVNRTGTVSAFKVSTGDKLFDNKREEGCRPTDFVAMNGKMLSVATCQDVDKTVQVMDADPATGKNTWIYKLPKGFDVKNVYSLDPIVLDLGNEAKERSIVVLGPDGKQRATVSGEGTFPVGCGGLFSFNRSLQSCGSSYVDANTLYLPTKADIGKPNEVVAFDLGTGKVKWRTPAGEGRTLTPLKAAGGKVVVYREAESDKGGEVLTIPAAGGTPTAVLRNPSGAAAPVESSFYSPNVDYVDGRLFISASHLKAENKSEKFLMVFGK
ncbi:PQQ-binding-like beta-propeller repeat protein [Streptomyces sp. NBC_01264]|uniref:outer membrane protein assembly factor BamB family protein n=1 Tax=Streptomyces sp. NBC_01264 TaxID=2903804 RepID=UPI00225AF46F|nr:PQQ-binding-like beta-propeller repeat protein [Streptomyces sp. NBC_01264]MCX4778878.1 PQQ-binding-like beta-propeller repeat protein [Streptomyces sp. NBC_01264]